MDRSPESVWNECLDIIRDNVNRQSYKTWFEPLTATNLEQKDGQRKLTVQLPSNFYYEWLEEHYFGLLRKTITKVLGDKGRLYYDIVIERDDEDHKGSSIHRPARQPTGDPPSSPAPRPQQASQQKGEQQKASDNPSPPAYRKWPPQQPSPEQPSSSSQAPEPNEQQTEEAEAHVANPFAIPGIKKEVDSQLNPSYTFDRFIEGDCNELARNASLAIAQDPGATSFNPFLIYGGVGLGKTHLIQAIGNYAEENHNVDTILYVSSERFTTEFVQSIQRNNVNEFSLFYRQIDLLVVDDIQFFGGKEKTQEEFFHIFNALHQSGKQIVLSADRPPREIEGIEERLLSRFQWGLSADVQPPGLETRIAILQRKAEDDGIEIPHEVIEFIAHNIESNIRELEGALIRLLAHATLHKEEPSLQLAKEVLRDLIKKDKRVNLTIEEIQRISCEYFEIPEDLVRARTRKREVVQARQVAMYFSKQLTQHSLKKIGLHFGGRDHSTVIHANRSVEDQIETDPQFKNMIEEVRRRIELQSR